MIWWARRFNVIGEHAYLVLRESDRVRFFDKFSRVSSDIGMRTVESGA
jgi:hypothetical protein